VIRFTTHLLMAPAPCPCHPTNAGRAPCAYRLLAAATGAVGLDDDLDIDVDVSHGPPPLAGPTRSDSFGVAGANSVATANVHRNCSLPQPIPSQLTHPI
jgi:hypothetical protein